MSDDRTLRRVRILVSAALALSIAGAAVVPGEAWAPGSAALADAARLDRARVLHRETALTITPLDRAAMVSTGDGGGAGRIDGFDDGALRVRAASFRGTDVWEIGTAPGAPAAYVDDNGVRRDDGMMDRLAVRAWPAPAAMMGLALLARLASRRDARIPRWSSAALLALAAAIVAAHTA